MTTDVASLVVAVDASQVTPAATKLDTLTAAGTKAEAATSNLNTSTDKLRAAYLAAGGSVKDANKIFGATAAATEKLAATQATAAAGARSFAQESIGLALARARGEEEAAAAAVAGAEATVAAHGAIAGSSIKIRESLVLLREASVGNFTRMAGSASILLGVFGLINAVLLPIIAVGAALGATFLLATEQIRKSSGDLTQGLGLTADQLDRLNGKYGKTKETMVTFKDTIKATFQVLGKDLSSEFSGTLDVFAKGFQWIVNTVKDVVADYIGVWIGGFRVLEEAYKLLPTFLGGEGKSFSIANFATAFMSGIDTAKTALNKFYSDVAAQAKKNRIDEILKEAGRPGGQGVLNSAEKQLTETRNQLDAQTKLNAAVESGAITIGQANEQTKIDSQLKRIIAERDNASGAMKAKLTSIINQLIPAVKGLTAAQEEYRQLQQNDRTQQQIDVLKKQIELSGQDNETRAVAIAQFKELQRLKNNNINPNSAAGKAALSLAGQSVSASEDLGRASLLNANVDAGGGLATSAVKATLASDPQNYIKQQKAAYAELDKLRQADKLSEQEAAQAKAKIDADVLQQRLSNTQDFFGNLATLSDSKNKELAAIGKAAAISQATIDGVLAVQKALAAYPPPINFIEAAGVGIAAAANVAKIAGLATGGTVYGPGGPTDDKVLMRLSPGEEVINAKAANANRPLLKAINSGQNVGTQIKVVIEDHGTPKTYTQAPGLNPNEVRLIARDEANKAIPNGMAKETANPNSPFRKTLSQHTDVKRKMAS